MTGQDEEEPGEPGSSSHYVLAIVGCIAGLVAAMLIAAVVGVG